MNRLNNLDGLRGIFSLMVVLYHYSEKILPEFIYNNFLIRSSDLFVDFFFVLSGFVICLNYKNFNHPKQLKVFISKRFFRLYPLLFYTVSVFLFFEIIGSYFFSELINNSNSVQENINNTLESLTFMNSTPILGTSMGMNYPSWSISSEMISYLTFGLIMILPKNKNRILLNVIVVLISIIILFSLGGGINSFLGDYGFIRGLISFFLGVLVSEIYLTTKIIFRNYLEIISVLIIVISLYTIHNQLLVKEASIVLIPLIFSFSILVFSKTNGNISKILQSNLFQFFGKISYSIYLNHGLLIIFIPKIIFNFLGAQNNLQNQLMAFLISILFLITYSYFTYKFVEIKIGGYLKNKVLESNIINK